LTWAQPACTAVGGRSNDAAAHAPHVAGSAGYASASGLRPRPRRGRHPLRHTDVDGDGRRARPGLGRPGTHQRRRGRPAAGGRSGRRHPPQRL
jgi:hypothetical protein